MNRPLLAAVAAAGIATAALADPPSPDVLAAKLGADSFAEREAAELQLAALGPAAIPALRDATRSSNPEASRRAAALLDAAELSAQSARLLAPNVVRLAYRDEPLAAAVGDLKTRTGVNLALDPAGGADPTRKVTCETAELPAWEAVEAFCKAAGLREVFRAELEAPRIERRGRGYYMPPPPPPTASAVPVLLADGPHRALPGARSLGVRVVALPPGFPGNRVVLGTGEFTLNLDVTPTAGLNWRDAPHVKLTRVIDDAGRAASGGTPLTAPAESSVFEGLGFGNPGVALRIAELDGLALPPVSYPNPRATPVAIQIRTAGSKALRVIEGAVVGEVTVPNQELIVVANPAAKVGTTATGPGGVKFTVRDYQTGRDGVTVRLAVESPGGWTVRRGGLAANRLWQDPLRPSAEGNHVTGYGADGARLLAAVAGPTEMTEDGANVTLTYALTYPAAGGAPAKFVVLGARPVAVEVPFRLENVPLP